MIQDKHDEGSSLNKFCKVLADVEKRLESRQKVAPEDFVKTLNLREKAVDSAPFVPAGSVEGMFPGTWYLTGTDSMHRRSYDQVPSTSSAPYTNGHAC